MAIYKCQHPGRWGQIANLTFGLERGIRGIGSFRRSLPNL